MRTFTKKDAPKPAEIRALRESSGLSQTRAACKLFVSLRTWQNWEAGKHCMHPAMWDSFKAVVSELRR